MPLSSEEDEFLEVASVALPRIIEIIATFLAEHRAGAFEVAERRYMQAARDFGCTEEAATRWVAPAETIAAWPTTVATSRCPRALARSTQKPFSAL
jgi:hypothetical protein